jgi:hypothetical protein
MECFGGGRTCLASSSSSAHRQAPAHGEDLLREAEVEAHEVDFDPCFFEEDEEEDEDEENRDEEGEEGGHQGGRGQVGDARV